MHILLSNDDGIHAPGLQAVKAELKKIADVTVVAPKNEKSAAGHSITIKKSITMEQIGDGEYAVDGSPADCIIFALEKILSSPPDYVISGANYGINLGHLVFYSGTVAAAREACIQKIPAMAVSLAVDQNPTHPPHFQTAAELTRELLEKGTLDDLPNFTMLNMNVPDLPRDQIKGISAAKQGFPRFENSIVPCDVNENHYFIHGGYKGYEREPGADTQVVDENYASLTPIQLDTTDYNHLKVLQMSF